MTKSTKSDRPEDYVVAIEVEGFLPLDPRDPENLDRKHPENWDQRRLIRDAEEHRAFAEEQRKTILAQVESVAGERDLVLADKMIRDDGTGELYFRFEPKTESEYASTEGGATTWDSALRNHIEPMRSTMAGAGLQVNGIRVEGRDVSQANATADTKPGDSKPGDSKSTEPGAAKSSDSKASGSKAKGT